MELRGRTAVVRRGERHRARHRARRRGHAQAVADLDAAEAGAVARELGAGTFPLALHVTSDESREAAAKQVAVRTGGVHVLVEQRGRDAAAPPEVRCPGMVHSNLGTTSAKNRPAHFGPQSAAPGASAAPGSALAALMLAPEDVAPVDRPGKLLIQAGGHAKRGAARDLPTPIARAARLRHARPHRRVGAAR